MQVCKPRPQTPDELPIGSPRWMIFPDRISNPQDCESTHRHSYWKEDEHANRGHALDQPDQRWGEHKQGCKLRRHTPNERKSGRCEPRATARAAILEITPDAKVERQANIPLAFRAPATGQQDGPKTVAPLWCKRIVGHGLALRLIVSVALSLGRLLHGPGLGLQTCIFRGSLLGRGG